MRFWRRLSRCCALLAHMLQALSVQFQTGLVADVDRTSRLPHMAAHFAHIACAFGVDCRVVGESSCELRQTPESASGLCPGRCVFGADGCVFGAPGSSSAPKRVHSCCAPRHVLHAVGRVLDADKRIRPKNSKCSLVCNRYDSHCTAAFFQANPSTVPAHTLT